MVNASLATVEKRDQNRSIENPYVPIFGVIQPNLFLKGLEEGYEDGLSYRFLFEFAERVEMEENWDIVPDKKYSANIVKMYNDIYLLPDTTYDIGVFKNHFKFYKLSNDKLSNPTEKTVPEIIKPALAKLNTYLGRFTLILSVVDKYFNGKDVQDVKIEKKIIDNAQLLINHYFKNWVKFSDMYFKEKDLNLIDQKLEKNLTPLYKKCYDYGISGLSLRETAQKVGFSCSTVKRKSDLYCAENGLPSPFKK
jgi:hypothetical protein